MQFIILTPVLIRYMWQLKAVVFLHWCLICNVLFHNIGPRFKLKRKTYLSDPSGAHTRCPTCGLWFKLGSVFKLHILSHQPKWKVHGGNDQQVATL
jgi:hypothetical protein